VAMKVMVRFTRRGELSRILELLEEADLPVAGVENAESF